LAGVATIANSIKENLQTEQLRDISATRVTRRHVKFLLNDGHHVEAASTSSSEDSGSKVEHAQPSILSRSLGPQPTAPTMRSSLSRKGRSDQGSRNVQHNSTTTEPYEPHGVVVKPSAGAKASYGHNGNGAGPRIASTSDGIGHKRDLNKTEPSERAKFSCAIVALDENDIVHCELSMVGHQVQCEILSGMERAIEDRECADEIAGLRESGSLSMQDQQAEFGIAASTTPVRTFNLKNYIALLERRRALKATRARVATEHAEAAVDKQQAYTAWRDESPGDDANEETPRQGRSSDFLDQAYAGAGYGAKISQVEARRGTTANSVSEWDSILNMSGGARRQVRREARMASSATEPKYMAFDAFEDASSARSMVVSQETYSAVDTGTTVTIAKADGTQLESFDPQSALRIMGFNGSTTRSQGTGVLVGFAKDRQGRQIELRVPNAHLIKGAPSDLLSVSSLVALGYSFHFTPQVSYIVTPQGDIVDLIVKKGLYWLKWEKPIDPLAARRPRCQRCAG